MNKRKALLICLTVILALMMSFVSCGSPEATTYKISFKGTETPISAVEVNSGEVPEIPEVPAKEGYTAIWTLDGKPYDAAQSYAYDKDIELVALYTPIVYKVTFMADGGLVKTLTYTVESNDVAAPNVPEKAGYSGAWESYTLTTGDVIINAVYTAVGYKVTFKADAEIVSEQTYTEDNKNVIAPEIPAKAGYTAVWENYELNNSDITVNAIYTPNTDTQYKVEHYIEKLDGSYELHSSASLSGTTDTTASADAISIDHYVAKEASASGNIAGDGSLVIKLYYNLELIDVIFNYGGAQEDSTAQVKYGATVAKSAAKPSTKYPFELLEWTKDGVAFDFNTVITESITLTATYADQKIYDNFEGEEDKWIDSKATHEIITSGVISGAQSLQFVATSTYQGVYRQNLTDAVDFTDVNYIYFKVKVNTATRITVRFFKENNTFAADYLQMGADLKADGAWHLVCVDMSALESVGEEFGKDQIKAMFIMSSSAATVQIDDILFAQDSAKVDDSILSYYGFNSGDGWFNSSDSKVTTEYADGAANINITAAYNGIYTTRLIGSDFANVKYIYVKVKATSDTSISIRFYKGVGIQQSYIGTSGVAVASDGEYHIIRFDISDWNALSSTSNTSFDKSETITMLIRTSSATTISIDDVVFAQDELNLTYKVIFKAGDFVETQTYTVFDQSITVPTVPEKDGYTAKWSDYTLGYGDVVVNAVYTPISYKVTFRADSVLVKALTYTVENKNIVVPAVPEKAGYTGEWEVYTLTTGDVEVNAVYTPIVYNVIFKADDVQVGNTLTYTVENKEIVVPAVPEKAGYTGEWEAYTLTTGDVTVNAVYTPITYTVTFVADGVTVDTRTYTVENKSITEPDVPAKPRHTGAWEAYTLTTGDIIVNAVYTPATEYKVIFKADGVQVGDAQTYTADDKNITAPEIPAKAGYTAVWESYELNESDVTVNAIYTPNTDTQYKVEHYIEKLDGSYELYSSETLSGTTDATASAEAVTIDHFDYVADGSIVSGTIAGDGSLVLKLYYNRELVDVTFNYGGAQEDSTVQVKYGATVAESAATPSTKYPFALVEWQKDGAKFSFDTAITESTTLTAVYANEYVYDDFETDGTWNKSSSSGVTYSYVTNDSIFGNQSLKFTATANNGVYRQNLHTLIDFTDVNYIYFKVRVSVDSAIAFRFFNANAYYGNDYVQGSQTIKADGAWHLACIDMNALTAAGNGVSKSEIKSMLIRSSVAATIEIDDIIFVRDNESYNPGAIMGYGFETEDEKWYSSNKVDGAYVHPAYVTDEAGDKCIEATVTAWNGVFIQSLDGAQLAEVKYIYVKVKSSAVITPGMRIYSGLGIGANYVSVTGVPVDIEGTTVAADGEYHIVKYDISDWSKLAVTGTAFDKTAMKTMFIRVSANTTITIDEIVFATSELTF